MTDKPKRGGRRNPPGGRPRKDNVILHCHVPPFILESIDLHRGGLSRGEYIALLVIDAAMIRSSEHVP
jgi:hypothetical protein